jgi:hypothetical protein
MRRWLVTIMTFLVAGAVVNVAVAWAYVLRFRTQTMPVFARENVLIDGWVTGAESDFDLFRALGWQQLPEMSSESQYVHVLRYRTHVVELIEFWELRAPRSFTGSYVAPQWRFVRETNAGWPMYCLAGLLIDTQGYEKGARWFGRQVNPPLWRAVRAVEIDGDRPLPFAIIWPGFVVNTLFYAAILWLLICGPFVLRRFVRVKRGLCPVCAYPRGDSAVCTECGKALPKRAVA